MRRNVERLSTQEWDEVVAAFNSLKSSGRYDEFTRRHVQAMMEPSLSPGESGTLRNMAHRGPVFLPWHRQYLREFEQALGVDLPYWNWEPLGANWHRSPVWDLVGGNGVESQGWRIDNGPFVNWNSIIFANGSFIPRRGIIRQFSNSGSIRRVSVRRTLYDVAPWREDSDLKQSFRRHIEIRHNTVHNLIGGDMSAATSPNDPLFWLHHCNVDRIYSRWLRRHGPIYLPITGGPPGHNASDPLRQLNNQISPQDLLNDNALGIEYDTLR